MNELLKALADNDRELEAAEAVEMRLRSAFRKQHARPKWPYFALAAALAVAVFIYSVPKAQTMQIAVVTPTVPEIPATKTVRQRAVPREVMTDFYPLMEDPLPFERGELLRVSLPASAMRGVGLPVNEDRLSEPVQADILVGQEGLARAIRFVRYEY